MNFSLHFTNVRNSCSSISPIGNGPRAGDGWWLLCARPETFSFQQLPGGLKAASSQLGPSPGIALRPSFYLLSKVAHIPKPTCGGTKAWPLFSSLPSSEGPYPIPLPVGFTEADLDLGHSCISSTLPFAPSHISFYLTESFLRDPQWASCMLTLPHSLLPCKQTIWGLFLHLMVGTSSASMLNPGRRNSSGKVNMDCLKP